MEPDSALENAKGYGQAGADHEGRAEPQGSGGNGLHFQKPAGHTLGRELG